MDLQQNSIKIFGTRSDICGSISKLWVHAKLVNSQSNRNKELLPASQKMVEVIFFL